VQYINVRIVAIDAGDTGRLLCKLWANIGSHSTSDAPSDIQGASVVLLGSARGTTPGEVDAGLAGKIVIDCSSASNAQAFREHSSRAEALAEQHPGARIVKALNAISVGALEFVAHQKGPEIHEVFTSAFYCGDDAEAKSIVASLISEINLDPIDCGPLSNAVLLDGLGVLEQYLGAHVFRSLFAITVVRKPADRSPLDRWM